MSKKVLIAKPGFDGHWRGAVIVSMALRDAGLEVIYLGNQTPEAIVQSAVQEDVDIIGLSILAAGHLELIKQVIDLVRAKKMKDVLLMVGGTIPQEDVPQLKQMGVHGIFPPGSKVEKIVEFVQQAG
jgi:methylmalonyl-CoA mutase C-terminal domain/subunit